jgi:hypothetical protein
MNSTTSTSAITDPLVLSATHTVNAGYVGAILPFIILAFLFGVLNDMYNFRARAARAINARYGAYWRSKIGAIEERLELEEEAWQKILAEREVQRLEEEMEQAQAPLVSGNAMV